MIWRIDIGNHTVAVPLEVSHIRILRHDTIHDAEHIILYLRITDIKYQLVAVIISITLWLHNHPVGMLLKEFTLRIHHLRLNPNTKLYTSLLGISYQSWYSIRQLALGSLPVAETCMVVLARILVGKPTIIKQEHIYTQVLGILHQLSKTLLIEVEAGILPVVQERKAIFHTHVYLILASPIVQITGSLTNTIIAHGKDKLRGSECLTSLQLIIRGVWIDGRDNTKGSHVINLEGKAEVARPSDGSKHHLALILLGWLIESQFKERLLMHGCTGTQLGINNFLTSSQLASLRLSFLSPVAMIIGNEILVCLEIKHCRAISPKRYRSFLLMRDFAPCLDDVLLRVSCIVELHGQRIYLVLKSDDGLNTSTDSLFFRRQIIQIGSHITICVGHCHCRLEEIFSTRGCINLMTSLADGTIRSRIYIPLQMIVI